MARIATKKHMEDDVAAIALAHRVSQVVLALAKKKGMTQSEVARRIGYARSSFCQMVNTQDISRLWRLPALCAVCRVLGISVADLVLMADLLPMASAPKRRKRTDDYPL